MLACLASTTAAQTKSKPAASPFQVRTWSTADGLPQVSVENVFRSRSGVVWLTCDTGLHRFDGTFFEPINLPGGDRRLIQLVELPDQDALVALSRDGSLHWIPWTGEPRELELPNAFGALRRIAMPSGTESDRRLPLLAAFEHGLLWMNPSTAEFEAIETEIAREEPRPRKVRIATDGRTIWVARGRKIYEGPHHGPVREVGLVPKTCQNILADADGTAWFAASSSVFRSKDGQLTELQIDRPLNAYEHVVVDENRMWLGTSRFGLQAIELDPSRRSGVELAHLSQPEGLGGYSIRTMVLDSQHGVWVGTVLGGFSLIRERQVEIAPVWRGLRGTKRLDAVFGVLESSDGTVWAGTRRSGLWYRKRRKLSRVEDGVGEHIQAIAEDSRGRIWAGGWDSLSVGTLADGFTELEGIEFSARGFASASDGSFWVASDAGALSVRYDDGALQILTRHLQDRDVWSICDAGGRLFCGGGAGELFRLRPGADPEPVELDGAVTGRISDLFWDGSTLWITDIDGGLATYRDGAIRKLQIDSLSPIYCLGIEPCGDKLCLSTTRGLFVFDPRTVEDTATTEVYGVWRSAASLGLVELNGHGGSAIACGEGDVVHLASIAGLATVKPLEFGNWGHEPLVALQTAQIDDVRVEAGSDEPFIAETVELTYRIGHFADPLDVQHEVRLLGRESEWTAGPADRRLRFAKLTPGDYRFQVRARIAGGSWSDSTTLLAFEVPKPFYASAWFLALVTLSIGGLALLRTRSTRRRESRLQELVTGRTAELQQQIERNLEVETELRTHRDQLDDQVRQRTQDLAEANERLRIELEERHRLEDELVRAQKLEGVARLAGGLAHDLNNLLTAIVCSSELAGQATNPDSTAHADIESTRAAAARASRLARRLLSFAKPQPLHEESFDLNTLISANFSILRSLVPKSIGLRLLTSTDPAWVQSDPSQLEQVLVNLVLNASQAIDSSGCIEIDTRPADEDEFVVLEIRDDGCGMSTEVRENALDPFFTTKKDGTGLGLPICADIVRRTGGTFEIDSVEGRGTTIRLRLRASSIPDAAQEDPASDPSRGSRAFRILLVEDQESLRKALSRALTKHGHDLVTATDGLEAEAAFEATTEPFDALVTDLVMPNRSGAELIRRLRERQPHLPAILMTGYTPEYLDDTVDDGPTAWLTKPFTPRQLTDALDRLLSGLSPGATPISQA